MTLRVLVCGTGYGATYLQSLWNHESGLRLAGLLTRGSERSRALAQQWGVPLWRTVQEIPHQAIDLACVAVASPAGPSLTLDLLRRGIHVLAEHPIASEDLEAALGTARETGTTFHVNAHYADLETVAPFLATATACHHTAPPLFVSALTNPRALYSCIELISRIVGDGWGRPSPGGWVSDGRGVGGEVPFVTIQCTLNSTPLLLHIQRTVTAEDNGAHLWASHQITAGFPSGTLLLAETAGPVVWIPAYPSVAELASPAGPSLLARPSWSLLSPPPSTTGDFFFRIRDRANRIALWRIAEQIRTGRPWSEQSPEHLLGVSRAWSAILTALGPLEVVS
jgi:thiazolinyl imide reductase